MSPRSRGGMLRKSLKASVAACSAASASWGVASAISVSVSPVAGSSTGSVPAEPSRHSPPMYSWCGTESTTDCSEVAMAIRPMLPLSISQPSGDRVRLERAGDVEALTRVAAERRHPLQRLGRLQTLGDDGAAEVVAELDRRAHYRDVALIGLDPRGERAVDLDLADRQLTQAAERRVPGAEVVQRQHDAEVVEAPQHGGGAHGVGHDRAFGDLELEMVRRHAGVEQDARDFVGEVGIQQAALGDVDRDREVVAGGLPRVDLLQRRPQDEARQRLDEAGLLGERDELARREQPVLGMLPAHERLDARDRPALQPQLGLVVQDELAAVQRLAQLAQALEPRRAVVVAVAVEQLELGAQVLGGVQ